MIPLDRRDRIFICYSRSDDRTYVTEVVGWLTPYAQDRGCEVWTDEYIKPGDDFERVIEESIRRSRVAVLLVSQAFLNSRFIREVELPALLRHEVTLVPMLVEHCTWDALPLLTTITWAHDQRRDEPLSSLSREGRTKRLTEVARGVRELLLPSAGTPPERRQVDAPAPDALATTPRPAELDGVPELPRSLVPRDERDQVVAHLTAESSTGAVGITGTGPQGAGGVGKSVLAAQVARDPRVLERFTAVHWVTVGQDADLAAVQQELLLRLGSEGPVIHSIWEGCQRLEQVLADQQVLLVVDDVWTVAAAEAFRVVGPRGRVLYTARDPAALRAVSAQLEAVGALTDDQALALAAGVLDGSLPDEAALQAFHEVGNVALAVGLVAATVRAGRSWRQVRDALTRRRPIFGAHPYADTFKAIELRVSSLTEEVRRAVMSFAVFPPDVALPVQVVARYWRTSHPRTHALLTELTVAELIAYDRSARTVRLHDLVLEYLQLHGTRLATRHHDLLAVYRDTLVEPSRGWWQLAEDEPYLWDHLLHHLRGAGDSRGVEDTYGDPRFLAKRISVGGTYRVDHDLGRARGLVPDDGRLGAVHRWLADHSAHLDDLDRTADVAATMRLWLQASPGLAATADQLDPLLPDVHLTVRWGRLGDDRPDPSHRITAVASSVDGTRIACGGERGAVLLDRAGEFVADLPGGRAVTAIAISPDPAVIALGGDGGLLLVRDTDVVLRDRELRTRTVAFSPAGDLLAAAGRTDGRVHVWEAPAGAHHRASAAEHGGWVRTVSFSPDGRRIASASDDGSVLVWDAETLRPLDRLEAAAGGWITCVRFAADGSVVAAGDEAHIRRWTSAGDPLPHLHGHRAWVTAMAFSPDGDFLLSGDELGELRLWNWREARCVSTQRVHECTDISWTDGGIVIATGGHPAAFQLRLRPRVPGRPGSA
ncbi:NB-ARC domain-containing protein [Geodermatophilus sp. SYSU D00742]